MKGDRLLDKMELIAPEYIKEAQESKKHFPIKRLVLVAAVILILSSIALVTVLSLKKAEPKPSNLPKEPDVTLSQAESEPDKTSKGKYKDGVSYNLLFPKEEPFEFSEDIKHGAIVSESTADIASFYEDFTKDSFFVEGRVTDMYEKRYDYTVRASKDISDLAYAYTMTVIYEFEITRVWSGDFKEGEKILIEDAQLFFDSQFHLKKGHKYLIPLQNAGENVPILSMNGVLEGDIRRESPYTTCYPYHPQIEITDDGYYFYSDDWESLVSESSVKVADVDFGEGSVYYVDKMLLLDAESFEIKMKGLIAKLQ